MTSLAFLPAPHCNRVLLVKTNSNEELSTARKVDTTHANPVRRSHRRQSLLRPRVPDVDLGLSADLTCRNDVEELGVFVDGKTDDVVGVFQVEALLSYNTKYHTSNVFCKGCKWSEGGETDQTQG